MDYTNRNWFGLGGPRKVAKVRGRWVFVKAWNCCRRVMEDGTVQGVGIVQVGSRHLLYLGSAYGRLQWSVCFIGETE